MSSGHAVAERGRPRPPTPSPCLAARRGGRRPAAARARGVIERDQAVVCAAQLVGEALEQGARAALDARARRRVEGRREGRVGEVAPRLDPDGAQVGRHLGRPAGGQLEPARIHVGAVRRPLQPVPAVPLLDDRVEERAKSAAERGARARGAGWRPCTQGAISARAGSGCGRT
eukprot:4499626-Prymnesium_polylepis.1